VTTRSEQLTAYNAVNTGDRTIYTCPVGAVVLLKGAVLTNYSGSAGWVSLQLSTVTAVSVLLHINTAMPASTTLLLEMWVVLHPGDRLTFSNTVTPAAIVVSGAVLPPPP